MKNSRGFTLVELLVAVVVLGIIMGLSFPVIRNIQSQNERKKYETYAEGMMTSARLYVNSYDEDMFGHHDTGCAYITYQELLVRDLIKDVPVPDISCDSENTFVRVVKLKNQYAYSYSLGCGKKENGAIENTTVLLPEESLHEMDYELCRGREATGANIKVSISHNKNYSRRKKSQVILESATGIHNSIVIYSTWTKGENEPTDENEWKRVEFEIPTKQEETILGGDIIEVNSSDIVSPSGDGEYYLWIRVDELKDLYGENWENPNPEESNYVHKGPFRLDNTPPLCTDAGDSTEWKSGEREIIWGCKDEGEGSSGCVKEIYGTRVYKNSTKTATIESYRIKDTAGNTTDCPARTANVYIDNTAPSCTLTGPSTVWTNQNRTITWGCDDKHSGCQIGYSGGSKEFDVTTKFANIASYEIRDNVGNKTICPAHNNVNVYVDKILPNCTDSGDSTTWTTGNRTINWGCEDKDSGCHPNASGGKTNFTTPTKTATIPAYTIKDVAGNTKTCPARVANVYADQKGPTITITNNPLSLGKQEYNFTSNVKITPGISGIATPLACTPASTRKTGSYPVSCSATSVAGKTTTVTFTARHSYSATRVSKTCQNCTEERGPLCRCSGSCGAHIMRCGDTCCGDGSPPYVADPNYLWATNCTDYDCSYYTCPNGGTLSGSVCYY